MHSVLLRLGEFQLHSYGLCMAAGILCAYGVLVRLGRSRGFSPDRLANLLALLVLCGLAGAFVPRLDILPAVGMALSLALSLAGLRRGAAAAART